MIRKSLLIIFLSSFITVTFAIDNATKPVQNAEELVNSKRQENINYQQLMELLGEGSALIHEGIIRENQAMVAAGTDLVMFHPAPNHKPWTIMAKKDQEAFKNTLLAYDKILHKHAEDTISFAEERNWSKANESASALTQSCISCHAAWKAKVVR